MCGIVVYIGDKEVVPSVLNGLKKLEYRGYDSWGIVGLSKNARKPLPYIKKVGKISAVSAQKVNAALGNDCMAAVGHTRWATHGGVSEKNSHPHFDCRKRIAVVHNGIIENYQELKSILIKHGHRFVSDTDTEVFPHLVEEIGTRNRNSNLVQVVRKAARMIKGRSAFIVLDSKSGEIVAVRAGTPLIFGIKDHKAKEFYISSDVNAFLPETNKVMYLDNGEMVSLNAKNRTQPPKFLNIKSGKLVKKRIIEIDWKNVTTGKEGYGHFLIKEIMEQKHTLSEAINQDNRKILAVSQKIMKAYGTFFVGSGTAGKVCMVGDYLFSKIAEKHINAVIASEFKNYQSYFTPKTLMIAVSQSGETADVLEAIDVAKEKGVKVISLLNVFGSTMMRESDAFFMMNAGTERAVASTKATTSQLAVLTLLAYAAAGKLQEGKTLLLDTASEVNNMLNPRYEAHIANLAKILHRKKEIFIIGRGLNYPIAQEAAIKLQETSYINAQGFAGGELKHGPLALIEKGSPCIALVPNDETKRETIGNAMEVKARGGYIIGIAPERNDIFDYWIKVPDAGNASPIVNIIPVQILAYHLALLKGYNPDYPRNLAKSVTVK